MSKKMTQEEFLALAKRALATSNADDLTAVLDNDQLFDTLPETIRAMLGKSVYSAMKAAGVNTTKPILELLNGASLSSPEAEILPVAGTTSMLSYRVTEGQKVYTYQDLANGLQIDADRVRKQFSRNATAWDQAETGVGHFDTPSGTQEVRWFTARGAMRFCRYIKSGRSDELYNHLLDLWEKEQAQGPAQAKIAPHRNPVSELDRMAGMMNQMLPALSGKIMEVTSRQVELDTRLAAVEVQQKATDPRAIEARMRYLEDCKSLLVFGTKGKPQAVTWASYWRELKDLIGINSFTNRAALTVPMMDKCVAYAQEWCKTRGVNPPSLFDEQSA